MPFGSLRLEAFQLVEFVTDVFPTKQDKQIMQKTVSMKHVNIIALKADGQGIIVSRIIHFELGCHQALEIHKEKQDIFMPTEGGLMVQAVRRSPPNAGVPSSHLSHYMWVVDKMESG